MTRKIVTDSIREFFDGFVKDVELYDEHGRILGRFHCSEPTANPENWERLTPAASDEEWQQACETGEYGISTQELLNHLKGRA